MANSDLTVPCITQDNNLPIPAVSVTPSPSRPRPPPLSPAFLPRFSSSPTQLPSHHSAITAPRVRANSMAAASMRQTTTLSSTAKQPLHARSSAVTAAAWSTSVIVAGNVHARHSRSQKSLPRSLSPVTRAASRLRRHRAQHRPGLLSRHACRRRRRPRAPARSAGRPGHPSQSRPAIFRSSATRRWLGALARTGPTGSSAEVCTSLWVLG